MKIDEKIFDLICFAKVYFLSSNLFAPCHSSTRSM